MSPTGYRVWECKIVVRDDVELPDGFDFPPRRAAIDAVTDRGIGVVSCFSGWHGELLASERNLLPRDKFDYPATGERLAMKVDTRKFTSDLASLSERLAALEAKVLDTNHDAPPGARVSDRQCASPADTGANTAGRDMGNGVFVASTAEVLAMHEETVARLTAESEQLAHERDIYISNELSALRSWQKALTERDEARRERDTLRAERIAQALTADRFAAAVAEADTLKARLEELEDERNKLRRQLPPTMQNCTIVFKECEFGHHWLTATNWAGHGCPWCEHDTLRARLAKMKAAPAASGAAGAGWLTEDERLAVSGAILILDQQGPTNIGRSLNDLLAREMPPEVQR